jgi:hypothetical protein
MDTAEKYQLVARSLREVADSAAEKQHRGNALALAAFFDRLAEDAEKERIREINSLLEGKLRYVPIIMPEALRNRLRISPEWVPRRSKSRASTRS